MLSLKEIDFREFERDVYKYYLDAFPKVERQPKKYLKELNEKNTIKFVKMMDEDVIVGFLIYATLESNPYVWLDYFAIRKEYQNKNYGSKAIQIFKDFFTKYDGIYGEFEKEGSGVDDRENEIRQKRAKFWKKAGFELLNIDVSLYGVIYSSCVLRLKDSPLSNEKIVERAFQIYEAVMGEKEIQKNCFIVKTTNLEK